MTKEYKDQRTVEQVKGQDGTCPTVVIKDSAGNLVRINAHDYNAEKHGAVVKEEAAAAPAPSSAAAQAKPDTDWSKKTVPELKDYLADAGVSFDTNAKKDDLIALCVEAAAKK